MVTPEKVDVVDPVKELIDEINEAYDEMVLPGNDR